MKEARGETFKAPTRTARDLLRRFRWFFMGFGIGLAPFLGIVNLPGFRSLMSVMPFQIREELIPLSAFLMGIVAQAVDFYAAERISRPALKKLFGFSLIAMLTGFFLFVALRNEFTVPVERGRSTIVTVMVGPRPTRTCPCWKIPNADPVDNPEACIQHLSFKSSRIARCWDRRSLNRIGLVLSVSYLILTGGACGFVGLGLLQAGLIGRKTEEQEKQAEGKPAKKKQTEKKKGPKSPKRPKPAGPTAVSAPAEVLPIAEEAPPKPG